MNSFSILIRKLHRASRLSPTDWLFFIEAWFWLLVFDIGLRVQPFSKLQRYATLLTPGRTHLPEQTMRTIRALDSAVNHARYNHIYPMTCLRRSLVLQKMLSERGISTELKIGTRKDRNQLSAHAWLEYDNTQIGETENSRKFIPLQKQLNSHTQNNQASNL